MDEKTPYSKPTSFHEETDAAAAQSPQGDVNSVRALQAQIAQLEQRIAASAAELAQEVEQRKRAEQALAETEQKANDLIRFAPTAIYEIDFRGPRFTRVNDAMCVMSGYTREELLAQSPLALLDPDSGHKFQERIRRSLAGEPIDQTVEYKAIGKDGREIFTVLQTQPIFEGGKAIGAFVIAHDVTEHRIVDGQIRKLSDDLDRQTKELRRQLAEIDAIYNSAAVGLSFLDTQLHYVRINERLAEINGIPAADHIGRTVREMVPDRADHAEELLKQIKETGQPVRDVEFKGTTAAQPGIGRTWMEQWIPLKDDQGRVLGINIVAEEVTERRRAEQLIQDLNNDLERQAEELRIANSQLEQQSHELQQMNVQLEQALFEEQTARAEAEIGQNTLLSLMSHAPGIILIADAPDVNIRMMSHHAETLLERPLGELLGVPGEDHPFRRNLFKPDGVTPQRYEELPIVRAVTRGEAVFDYEMVLRRQNAPDLIIVSSAGPIRDHKGQVLGAVGVWTDITFRKRIETKVQDLNRELESRAMELSMLNKELEDHAVQLEITNRDLESFTYSVSHDLRTPLATIDSIAQMMQEDNIAQNPAVDRHLALIRAGTQQMKQLIESLLDLSHLSRRPARREDVSMALLAEQALETLHEKPLRQGLMLEIKDLPDAHADPVLLKQVWVNLIANALKFTRACESPRIEIGCGPHDGEDRVYYVRDNGVGFDMEQADRLFGVFQRLHPEEEYEGTGIGLAIVQRIILRHGGRVWAEGEVGKGAAFYFTIPR